MQVLEQVLTVKLGTGVGKRFRVSIQDHGSDCFYGITCFQVAFKFSSDPRRSAPGILCGHRVVSTFTGKGVEVYTGRIGFPRLVDKDEETGD